MNEINNADVKWQETEAALNIGVSLSEVSQELERDSRRYNRAFTEESEVGVK